MVPLTSRIGGTWRGRGPRRTLRSQRADLEVCPRLCQRPQHQLATGRRLGLRTTSATGTTPCSASKGPQGDAPTLRQTGNPFSERDLRAGTQAWGVPRIPHNSSATGMQAIPAAGAAMGLQYRETHGLGQEVEGDHPPIVLCSIGDAATTEGEVSEALYMATLRQLPILFLVQDNEWDISAHASEIRFGDAMTMAQGFPGLESRTVAGHDLAACKDTLDWAFDIIRTERRPVLVHATVPLLGHHTSGVRREWYRDDLDEHAERDPMTHLRHALQQGVVRRIGRVQDASVGRSSTRSTRRAGRGTRAGPPAPARLHHGGGRRRETSRTPDHGDQALMP